MAEELKKQGLFVDESYVLRVLEPNVAKETQDLKEENEVFLESKFSASPVKTFYLIIRRIQQFLFRADRFSQSHSRNSKPFGGFCDRS